MLPMPQRVIDALPTAARPKRAEWSNDGGVTWTPAKVGSAKTGPDRKAECRYSGSAELLDVPVGRDGINTVATQVRMFQGIKGPRMDNPFWVPAGVYVVDRARRTRLGVSLELLGLEDVIRSADFVRARNFGPAPASSIVPILAGEALPTTPIAWREGINPDQMIPKFLAAEDRWQALSSGTDSAGAGTGIAAALGGEIYVDARGVLTLGPVPTLDDPVVWRIPHGQALVQAAEEQTAEGLVNVWKIMGDGGDGKPTVGPIWVWDDDPTSLTYAGPDPVRDPLAPQRLGLSGVRVRVQHYTSPLITSVGQAYVVGRAKLADSLGIQASLSFTSLCHPGLEAGDVVEVEIEPDRWERHLLESCPYELGGISMACTTRTSARRLT